MPAKKKDKQQATAPTESGEEGEVAREGERREEKKESAKDADKTKSKGSGKGTSKGSSSSKAMDAATSKEEASSALKTILSDINTLSPLYFS
jgi:hypothetical protein